MRFTKAQYEAAIRDLTDAMTQLEPDACPCAVCGDSGHMAWECGFNPLLAMALCHRIARESEALHETLHYLAGHDSAFGERLGPARVVMPRKEE